MSPFAGPLFAAAIVLGVAGILKATRPDPTRIALRSAGLPGTAVVARSLGIVEVAIAAYALVVGGAGASVVVAIAYAGFAGFGALVRSRTKGQASCGCFGSSDAPVTGLHVVVDLGVAALALATLADPPPGIVEAAGDTPLAGVPFVAFTLVLAWLLQVLLTALPELQAAGNPRRPSTSAAGTGPRP